MNLPYFYEFDVGRNLVNFFEKKLDYYKTINYSVGDTTCTHNGFQTKNILELQEKDVNQRLTSLKKKLESRCGISFEYSWAHMIEYYQSGHQEEHTHSHNEDFSAIIYLNSCDDGATYFKLNEQRNVTLNVLPKRGHAVMFSANIPHGGFKTDQLKKILVLGFRLNYD